MAKPHRPQWISKWIAFTTVDADGKVEKGYWLNNTQNNYRKVGLWVTGRVFSKHMSETDYSHQTP